MKGEHTCLDALADMRDAVEKAMRFVEGMTFEQFARDDKTVFAVVRALEIVGEAAKLVPSAVRKRHAKLPWREMAGMRDKLIHHYFGVNMRVVWNTVHDDLPVLKSGIRRMTAEISDRYIHRRE